MFIQPRSWFKWVLCYVVLFGLLVLPAAAATQGGDTLEFRPRLDTVTEPDLPPTARREQGKPGGDAHPMDEPTSTFPWVEVLLWSLAGGAGAAGLALLFKEPTIKALVDRLTFEKGEPANLAGPVGGGASRALASLEEKQEGTHRSASAFQWARLLKKINEEPAPDEPVPTSVSGDSGESKVSSLAELVWVIEALSGGGGGAGVPKIHEPIKDTGDEVVWVPEGTTYTRYPGNTPDEEIETEQGGTAPRTDIRFRHTIGSDVLRVYQDGSWSFLDKYGAPIPLRNVTRHYWGLDGVIIMKLTKVGIEWGVGLPAVGPAAAGGIALGLEILPEWLPIPPVGTTMYQAWRPVLITKPAGVSYVVTWEILTFGVGEDGSMIVPPTITRRQTACGKAELCFEQTGIYIDPDRR